MRFRILEPLFRSSRPASGFPAAARPNAGRASRPSLFTPSRALAQVHPDHIVPLNASFVRSGSAQQEPHFDQPPDRPPPDERTLKLGKSKCANRVIREFNITTLNAPMLTDPRRSSSDTASPATHLVGIPSSTRDPLATDFLAPLPFHAPAPAKGIGPSRLSCGTMDLAYHLGTSSSHRKCESRHSERTHGEERKPCPHGERPV